MDLNSLVIFAKVAELGSFSHAARSLKIPTSTVSRKIADLEAELGVRLLERSTRSLRLTDVGVEILRHAQHGAELSETVDNIVSNHAADVAGMLTIAVPPSVSDSMIAPLVAAFQVSYPNVRIKIVVSERFSEYIANGVDVGLHIGIPKDSALVARRILTYRHQLVASPAYIQSRKPPQRPSDLVCHRLLAFSHSTADNAWTFIHSSGRQQTIELQPYLSMNDYAGLVPALLAGRGIGDLPQIVQAELLRKGLLDEVMPEWRFPPVHLSVVHPAHQFVPRRVRVFNEFAAEIAPLLFPGLAITSADT